MLNPSYGSLHRLPGARAQTPLRVAFRGRSFVFTPYAVPGGKEAVRCIVLDHPLLAPTEPGIVYHGDAADRPYATDAGKFAFFGAAVAAWLAAQARVPDALHLHDWHCGTLAVLRAFDSRYTGLRAIRTAFTIHNLAYQGQRPKRGDASALDTWFPALPYDPLQVADPTNADVFNPMAAAIRLSDRVNAVSPTYAREIQQPSRLEAGFVGGEGLEDILRQRARDKALLGILNGCDYPATTAESLPWSTLRQLIAEALALWQDRDRHPDALEAHRMAALTLQSLPDRPQVVLTSVGRIVDQKMRLMFTAAQGSATSLECILRELDAGGLVILLGTGDPSYESQLLRLAGRSRNLLFLRGYSEALSAALYSSGDLFLMPSSFEPCGISQMLAMRSGQPCVVHGVGGLRDTVQDERTGFVFDGATPEAQARNFARRVADALRLRHNEPQRWESIRRTARARRFDWAHAARRYIQDMYEPH